MRTPPRQFRLNESVMAQLDQIAAHLDATRPGSPPHSRADAIRYAAQVVAELQARPTAKRKERL